MLAEQWCRFELGRDAIKCCRRSLVDPVALMSNYAATTALLIAFDMQLDPDRTLPLSLQ
jgi:hypothetical protein